MALRFNAIFLFPLIFGSLFGNCMGLVNVHDVVFVSLSQPNLYHATLATKFKSNLNEQIKKQYQHSPYVHLLHEDWPWVGGWTVFPILKTLVTMYGYRSSWIFIGEEQTRIKPELYKILEKFDKKEKWFIGKGLKDREATIIHHFAFHDNPSQFFYPDSAAGILLSMPLVKNIVSRLEKERTKLPEFSIDSVFELALFIWDDGKGISLTKIPELCRQSESHCVTYFLPFQICKAVPLSKIYFAVKTCEKFHKERIPVVKNTWGKETKNIQYFSEKEDLSIPTINLGVPNTETGHCAKTLAILKYVYESFSLHNVSWIVIGDDDTLFSISRLQKFLGCYNSNEAVALGERYGYKTSSGEGYDYITGGGGIIFSRLTVQLLIENGHCHCPSINTPDDMFLGMCLLNLGIPVTHSYLFHQARPVDYASEILEHEEPISFHKMWMIDPYKVYDKWLSSKKQNLDSGHKEL